MPTVPIYGTPNVAPAGVPGARFGVQAGPEAFGAGVARGATNLADTSFDIQQQERHKADQVRMLDLDRQLGEWENAKLYDPQNGALTKRGKDAFDLPQTVMEDYDTFSGHLQEGLTSDQQRLSAQQLIDGRRIAVGRAVNNHVAGEVRGFEDQAFKGVMDTSRNAALSNYTDPARVSLEADRQRVAVEGYARRNGLPDEWVADTSSKAQSQTYAGAIGRMLDTGNDLAAKSAYDQWRGNLTGEDAARIDSALKESSSRSESRRQADAILSGGATDLQGALSALEAANIKDTAVYDQTKARLSGHFQLASQAENEHQTNLFNTATVAIDQAPNPSDPSVVPATTWTDLKPQYKRELLSYMATKAKGVPVQTDWPTWYQLRSLASSSATSQDFLQTDLLAFRSKLSDEDFKSLGTLQSELRQNASKASDTVGDWGVVDRVANESLTLKGINPSTSFENNPDIATATAFRQQLDQAVAAVARGKPDHKVGYDEVRKVADRLLIDTAVTKPGLIYGTNTKTMPAFQAPGASRMVFSVEQIPAAERQRVIDGLSAGLKGAPLTPDMIVDAYNRVALSQTTNAR